MSTAPSSLSPSEENTNSLALSSLVIGITSVGIGWLCCGPWLAVLGVALGIASIPQIKRSGRPQDKSIAYWGIALSALGIILGIIGFVVMTFLQIALEAAAD